MKKENRGGGYWLEVVCLNLCCGLEDQNIFKTWLYITNRHTNSARKVDTQDDVK